MVPLEPAVAANRLSAPAGGIIKPGGLHRVDAGYQHIVGTNCGDLALTSAPNIRII